MAVRVHRVVISFIGTFLEYLTHLQSDFLLDHVCYFSCLLSSQRSWNELVFTSTRIFGLIVRFESNVLFHLTKVDCWLLRVLDSIYCQLIVGCSCVYCRRFDPSVALLTSYGPKGESIHVKISPSLPLSLFLILEWRFLFMVFYFYSLCCLLSSR